jgi:putative ABC transport system ATP-binding protein
VSAIRLRAVVKEYGPPGGGPGPRVRALDGVDLEVAPGERLAIMGPSGSGKSTLLHVLAGIEAPTGGEVWVAGRELGRLDDDTLTRHRRDAIGLVFQAFHLLPTLSARENVALPALLAGADAGVVAARARALLDEVGLADRADAMPHTLSGGEMQRVALARALVREPAVLLADEPTGNLDSVAAARVLERLAAVSRDHGATVVLVTHSAEAAAIAGRVVELRDGRVVADRRTPAS